MTGIQMICTVHTHMHLLDVVSRQTLLYRHKTVKYDATHTLCLVFSGSAYHSRLDYLGIPGHHRPNKMVHVYYQYKAALYQTQPFIQPLQTIEG